MSNFITHELARNLNLNQIQVDIPVAGINNSKNSISNAIVTNVFSTDRNYESTEEFLIVNQITSMIPTNSINLTNVQVPKGISLADADFYKAGPVQVLLGAGIFF